MPNPEDFKYRKRNGKKRKDYISDFNVFSLPLEKSVLVIRGKLKHMEVISSLVAKSRKD